MGMHGIAAGANDPDLLLPDQSGPPLELHIEFHRQRQHWEPSPTMLRRVGTSDHISSPTLHTELDEGVVQVSLMRFSRPTSIALVRKY